MSRQVFESDQNMASIPDNVREIYNFLIAEISSATMGVSILLTHEKWEDEYYCIVSNEYYYSDEFTKVFERYLTEYMLQGKSYGFSLISDDGFFVMEGEKIVDSKYIVPMNIQATSPNPALLIPQSTAMTNTASKYVVWQKKSSILNDIKMDSIYHNLASDINLLPQAA